MSGRIRTVKPEWLEDERIALLSPEARVLSVALLLLSDDEGRGRANETILAARVFPGLDVATLRRSIDDLSAIGFVTVYEADGQRYFEVRNFRKHQRIDRPKPSRLPPPPDASTIDRRTIDDAAAKKYVGLDQGSGNGSQGACDRSETEDPDPRHPPSGLYEEIRAQWHVEYRDRFGRDRASPKPSELRRGVDWAWRTRCGPDRAELEAVSAESGLPPAIVACIKSWRGYLADTDPLLAKNGHPFHLWIDRANNYLPPRDA